MTTILTIIEGEKLRYAGKDSVMRWGHRREKTCERCYEAAVERGIIEAGR